MIAFRLAWPAFAYSIDDESTAKRTYSYVLTYLLFICCWISIALGTLAPWLVQVLAPSKPAFYRADEAVGVLSFGTTAYAGYTVLAIGIGRARQTQFNWIVSGAAAALNVGLNFVLIPAYGMMGAAIPPSTRMGTGAPLAVSARDVPPTTAGSCGAALELWTTTERALTPAACTGLKPRPTTRGTETPRPRLIAARNAAWMSSMRLE